MKTKRNDLTPTKGRLIRGRKLNFGDDEPTPVKEKPKPKTKTINLPKEIRDEFYNPKSGLWNADKIYRKLKAKGIKVKLKEVKAILDNQLVTQVYKPTVKPKKDRFTTIVAKHPRDQYQSDLLDLKNYTSFNKGYRYLLNTLDVYSRYAYSVPVKTKTEGELIPAFEKVFEVMGKPKNLNTDLESAILGNKFQAVLQKEGIKHYQHNPVDDKRNMSIIERFNRTIRDVLVKYFYSRDTKNWVEILPDLLSNYNSTYHSTIKKEPKEIWNGDAKNEQKKNAPAFTIKVGDTVRILKRYSDFTKKSDTMKTVLGFDDNPTPMTATQGNYVGSLPISTSSTPTSITVELPNLGGQIESYDGISQKRRPIVAVVPSLNASSGMLTYEPPHPPFIDLGNRYPIQLSKLEVRLLSSFDDTEVNLENPGCTLSFLLDHNEPQKTTD